VLIVDALELEFSAGFTVFTGETGAGKSILIDALSLALGARAEGSVVRVGQAKAEISAEFDLTDTASERVADVTVDGQAVFTLAVRRTKKRPSMQLRNFHCYSLSPEENRLFHIPYQSEMSAATAWGSRSARLHLGSHPIADELRDLDMAPEPLLALDIPQYSLVSNRPEQKVSVGGWQDPRSFYRALRHQSSQHIEVAAKRQA